LQYAFDRGHHTETAFTGATTRSLRRETGVSVLAEQAPIRLSAPRC
jgi:hypothetical protein